jgi:pSer/pThr/pTyr-binding forkhead associated (FHA) protein
MGKLVLYLEDGRVQHIALGRERVVIGRRADNDVCLPYPAVSSEHAAVKTILADSFLEDMGSTNGTLVNGKPITKHFLRDHDEIDIGRQRLVYLSDDEAVVEGRTAEIARHHQRVVGEQVDRAEPVLRERRAFGAPVKAPVDGERRGSVVAATARVVPPNAAGPSTRPPKAKAPGLHPTSSASGGTQIDTFVEELVRMAQTPMPVPQNQGPEGRITVLSGANAGRSVIVASKDVVVGRVGFGVALIKRVADGYRLMPAPGEVAPTFAGTTVSADGAALRGGEIFEVAGARLEFVAPVRVGGD